MKHEVSQASSDASAAANQTLDAAQTVSEQTEHLNNEVASFLDSVRNG